VLIVLLLINGLIGFIEERNAGNAIAALKKSLAPKCSCKRDGHWTVIDAKELVPGDLITMKVKPSLGILSNL
jgi:H+-transporting ATPase